MSYVNVARVSDVPEGSVLSVEVKGVRVCLANACGAMHAFADNCSHREFPLSEGELDGDDCTITCEWHGAMFDIRSGKALSLPAVKPIPVYRCKVEDGAIWVDVSVPPEPLPD